MPDFWSDELGIAVDMRGCPNRCRHCYLGAADGGTLAEADLRWTVARFREFVASNRNRTPVRKLTVASWFREPDYADNYRDLHELEKELSDSGPYRYELLSIWRLARDPGYAEWARKVGPDTCQITFFGMEETNDWFHRRRGAFRDALAATERLLAVGMKPRWQLFLTRKLIPELPDLLNLVRDLKLRERVAELGGQFDLFMHIPGPDGEGRHIEHLRPTDAEVQSLPGEIIESSMRHFRDWERLWYTERELLARIRADEAVFPYAYPRPERLWMLVRSNWDVFSNCGCLDDWWKLGNLRADPVADILGRFERNEPPGLRTIHTVPPRDLIAQHANPAGTKVYSDKDDLLTRCVGEHCAQAPAGTAPSAVPCSARTKNRPE